MSKVWVMFEESNLREGKKHFNKFYRNLKVFSDFQEATKCMKMTIKKYADSIGDLFEGQGVISGIRDLSDNLLEWDFDVEIPGAWEEYDEDTGRDFISGLPTLLESYFTGVDMNDLVFPEGVDKGKPVILNVEYSINFDEVDGKVEIGNYNEENNEKINEMVKCYKLFDIFQSDENSYPPQHIVINTFKMDDPNINYVCSVVGAYETWDGVPPFMYLGLMMVDMDDNE